MLEFWINNFYFNNVHTLIIDDNSQINLLADQRGQSKEISKGKAEIHPFQDIKHEKDHHNKNSKELNKNLNGVKGEKANLKGKKLLLLKSSSANEILDNNEEQNKNPNSNFMFC